MDPIPDSLFLRKSGRVGNRTWDLWICSQKLLLLDHRGGDFNAHHPFCGNQDVCRERRKLFNAVENSELGILNSSQMTCRAKQYNMETAIDLAFADYELLALYKLEVEKDSWRSNHYPFNHTE
jgi:hypothetical protein